MIRGKEISPVEVVSAFIRRIEEINPKVNAFCTLTFDRAFDKAKRAEQAVGGDGRQALGPLHGVAFSVKDLLYTKGVRTMQDTEPGTQR
jgi:Asp-tRNA(Asn)/Glu-tRNA(Gln) amidotransferase A subunit family amidase